MLSIVIKYSEYIENIKEYMEESPYKTKYFINSLKLQPATFYRKLRLNTFDTKEIKTLTKLLFPKEAYYEEFKRNFKKSKQDIVAGRVVGAKESQKQAREKFGL